MPKPLEELVADFEEAAYNCGACGAVESDEEDEEEIARRLDKARAALYERLYPYIEKEQRREAIADAKYCNPCSGQAGYAIFHSKGHKHHV